MHWLVENIPAMPHVDFLYSHEALNEEDYQNIIAVRTEAGKVSGNDSIEQSGPFSDVKN